MHWLKRSAATCLAVLLLLTSLPMALAAPSDQPLTRGETASILLDEAKDYNKNVTYQDILKGYPNVIIVSLPEHFICGHLSPYVFIGAGICIFRNLTPFNY